MRMVTRIRGLVICAALALAGASGALALPIADGNTPSRAHVGVTFDTMLVALNNTRMVYLIQPAQGTARSNLDSLVTVWRNGGSTPRLRRIQHLFIYPCGTAFIGGTSAAAGIDLTIYRAGTASFNRFGMSAYNYLDLPIEADSIAITSHYNATDGGLALQLIYW